MSIAEAGRSLVSAFRDVLADLKEDLTPERQERIERALARLGTLSVNGPMGVYSTEKLEEELDAVRSVLADHRSLRRQLRRSGREWDLLAEQLRS